MLKKQAPKHTTATEARSRMAETGRNPTPLQAQVLHRCAYPLSPSFIGC